MKRIFPFLVLLLLLQSCVKENKSVTDANKRINKAQLLLLDDKYEQALIELDSINILYPDLLNERNRAKNLKDSIKYVQSKMDFYVKNAELKTYLAIIDSIIPSFSYEIQENNENVGKYSKDGLYLIMDEYTFSHKKGINFWSAVKQTKIPNQKTLYSIFLNLRYRIANTKSFDCKEVEFISDNDTINVLCNAIQNNNYYYYWSGIVFSEEESNKILNFIFLHKEKEIKVSLIGKRVYSTNANPVEIEYLAETYYLYDCFNKVNILNDELESLQREVETYERLR